MKHIKSTPFVWRQGVGERNEIPRDYVDHIEKYLPVMRSYNEDAAAQHLEHWIKGTLELQPLLDLSTFLVFIF